MRYRVELDELSSFVDRLQSFQRRAESLAVRIDGQVEALHATWSGDAAEEHRAKAQRVDDRFHRDARGAGPASSRCAQRPPELHQRGSAERRHADVTIQDVDTDTYYAVGKGLF